MWYWKSAKFAFLSAVHHVYQIWCVQCVYFRSLWDWKAFWSCFLFDCKLDHSLTNNGILFCSFTILDNLSIFIAFCGLFFSYSNWTFIFNFWLNFHYLIRLSIPFFIFIGSKILFYNVCFFCWLQFFHLIDTFTFILLISILFASIIVYSISLLISIAVICCTFFLIL